MYDLDDTIAAISTPIGQGGIGVIRLSGKKALAIAQKIFKSVSGKKIREMKNYTASYGWIIRKSKKKKAKGKNDLIDEALVTVMRAPRSFTKEDVVEISSHGGMVPLRSILHEVIYQGARLAEPGEFTRRAFLNGRLDLTQAEAIADIIRAKTETSLQISVQQLKGELTRKIESMRESLVDVYSEIEAALNFPEEDLDIRGQKLLHDNIQKEIKQIERWLLTSEQGRILKEGIKVVICGKTNVGKSSLLNALLKDPRAIVTKVAGTTRDTIEETASINGIPFQFIDTAGILKPRGRIEKEAVGRSRLSIKKAELILLVLDGSRNLSCYDRDFIKELSSRNVMVVINKCDLKMKIDSSAISKKIPGKQVVTISALKNRNIDQLENMICQNALGGQVIGQQDILLTNTRQINTLSDCLKSLKTVEREFQAGLIWEVISEGVKESIHHLDRITGRAVEEDLLDRIFSHFCVGK